MLTFAILFSLSFATHSQQSSLRRSQFQQTVLHIIGKIIENEDLTRRSCISGHPFFWKWRLCKGNHTITKARHHKVMKPYITIFANIRETKNWFHSPSQENTTSPNLHHRQFPPQKYTTTLILANPLTCMPLMTVWPSRLQQSNEKSNQVTELEKPMCTKIWSDFCGYQ